MNYWLTVTIAEAPQDGVMNTIKQDSRYDRSAVRYLGVWTIGNECMQVGRGRKSMVAVRWNDIGNSYLYTAKKINVSNK